MTILKAKDMFESLNPEEEQQIARAELKTNPNLEWLLKGFEVVREIRYDTDEFIYNAARKLLELYPGELSAKEIEQLSLLIPNLDVDDYEHYIGQFLSACINHCREDDITTYTKHLGDKPSSLGLYNRKNITIYGDVGMFLGSGMKQGEIKLYGNAGGACGDYLGGGTIHVYGNTDDTGMGMTNGKIIIEGNVGYMGHEEIYGGEIYVNGDFINEIKNHNIIRARVYHKGKLILEDGRFVE